MPRVHFKRDEYINNLFSPNDSFLNKICSELSPNEINMQLSSSEGKIIYLLLKIMKAHSAIEIGTLAGYSATWIARALGKNGRLYCFEKSIISILRYKKHLENNELKKRIEFIEGDAKEQLKEFNIQVDAVFIDADKSGYLVYLDHATRLLRPGGLLIADNVLLYGNVYGENKKDVNINALNNMVKFNNTIATSKVFEAIILPTHEGLLIARKKSSA